VMMATARENANGSWNDWSVNVSLSASANGNGNDLRRRDHDYAHDHSHVHAHAHGDHARLQIYVGPAICRLVDCLRYANVPSVFHRNLHAAMVNSLLGNSWVDQRYHQIQSFRRLRVRTVYRCQGLLFVECLQMGLVRHMADFVLEWCPLPLGSSAAAESDAVSQSQPRILIILRLPICG